MPNQPAADSTPIFIRVPKKLKAQIQADIDRINSIVPGANVTLSSWIRAAIDAQLKGNHGKTSYKP